MVERPFISRMDLAMAVRNKRHLYDGCIANGLILPALKTNLCTIEFLWAAKEGTVWVPKRGDVITSPLVARPPTIAILTEAITAAITTKVCNFAWPEAECESRTALMEELEKRRADVKFLVQVLYCVHPEHEIFQKRYRYRRPATAIQIDHIAEIGNENAFFDDLPELDYKELKKRQLRLPKKVR